MLLQKASVVMMNAGFAARRLAKFWLVLSALGSLSLTPCGSQSPTKIERAESGDSQVVVRAAAAKGQTVPTLAGSLLVKTDAAKTVDLRMRATHLFLENDNSIYVNRADVTIPQGTRLEPRQALDVRITVANIPRPGIYRGMLKFWAADGDETSALDVPIRLEVGVRPALALLGSAPQWEIVNCEFSFTCWLARRLLSKAAIMEARSFKIENQSPLAAQAPEVLTLLRGTTAKIDMSREVRVRPLTSVRGGGDGEVVVEIDRERLPPDAYEGTLRLRLAGTDESLAVPLVINVRDSPLIPLLVIFAGVIIGRLARQMDTPEIRAQIKALARLDRIQSDIALIDNTYDRLFLTREAAKARRLIDRGTANEQALNEALQRLAQQTDFLLRLKGLAEQETELNKPELTRSVAPVFVAARKALYGGNEKDAEEALNWITREINSATESAGRESSASIVMSELGPPERSDIDGLPSRLWRGLGAVIAFVSGDPSVGSGIRFWVVRPLLAVLLFIALVAVGLYTLYIKVPTFGASGFYEYLGLFVWGLGAEVAQRTLTSFSLPAR